MLLAVVLSLVFWSRLARLDDRLLLVYLGALAGAFPGQKMIYVLAEGWRILPNPTAGGDWPPADHSRRPARRLCRGGTLQKLIGYPAPPGTGSLMIVPASIVLGRIGCLLHGCCLGNVCESFHWWTLTDAAAFPAGPPCRWKLRSTSR